MLTEHRRRWQRTRRAKANSAPRDGAHVPFCTACACRRAKWLYLEGRYGKLCEDCLEIAQRSKQKQRARRAA